MSECKLQVYKFKISNFRTTSYFFQNFKFLEAVTMSILPSNISFHAFGMKIGTKISTSKVIISVSNTAHELTHHRPF